MGTPITEKSPAKNARDGTRCHFSRAAHSPARPAESILFVRNAGAWSSIKSGRSGGEQRSNSDAACDRLSIVFPRVSRVCPPGVSEVFGDLRFCKISKLRRMNGGGRFESLSRRHFHGLNGPKSSGLHLASGYAQNWSKASDARILRVRCHLLLENNIWPGFCHLTQIGPKNGESPG